MAAAGAGFARVAGMKAAGRGMGHPPLLKNGGIDPKEYTGFAFGWGVERTFAMKPGVKIDDIRLLNSMDLRVLKQL